MEDRGLRLIVALLTQVQRGHERLLRLEARIERLRSLKPTEEQSGGDEQRQTDRHLSHNQQVAQPRTAQPLPRSDAFIFER